MPDEGACPELLRARPQPACPACGAEGRVLYERVHDGSYGSPGEWTFRRCHDERCGAVWLDPVPAAEDLLRAYRNYYTHDGQNDAETPGVAKVLYRWVVDGLLTLTGVLPERRRADAMFLDGMTACSILDVGCGHGAFLARMARMGWTVVGVDFDPDAVANAQAAHGLDIRLGGVESVAGTSCFDVITASHVIEHVTDPMQFLMHCRRLLRPGGKLVLRTPNAESFGHALYRDAWRGLEPPRHLCILTRNSLLSLAGRAGLEVVECFTSHAMAESVLVVSYFLRKSGTFDPRQRNLPRLLQWKLLGPLFAVRAKLAWMRDHNCGEEVCAVLCRDGA